MNSRRYLLWTNWRTERVDFIRASILKVFTKGLLWIHYNLKLFCRGLYRTQKIYPSPPATLQKISKMKEIARLYKFVANDVNARGISTSIITCILNSVVATFQYNIHIHICTCSLYRMCGFTFLHTIFLCKLPTYL